MADEAAPPGRGPSLLGQAVPATTIDAPVTPAAEGPWRRLGLWRLFKRRKGPIPRSAGTYLFGVIAGVSFPLLIFSSLLVIRAARHEQDITAASAQYRTRLAADAVQDRLASLRASLLLLAGTLNLPADDLRDFHARARQAFEGRTVVLSGSDGQQLMNTSVPYGAALPVALDTSVLHRVITAQKPYVDDLSIDPLTNKPTVTIDVPVSRDGRSGYVLSLDMSRALPDILHDLNLPAGWVGTIFDRQGLIIARTRDPEKYIGEHGRPEFLAHLRMEAEGWIPGYSREGVKLLSAFAHTNAGGWAIVVGIPKDMLLAPVRETIIDMLLLGAVTLAAAISLALLIGRRIAEPVMALVPLAQSVGQGKGASPFSSGLLEANAVARSLGDADHRLRHEETERRQVTESLRASEQKHRAMAEDLARVDAERTILLTRMVAAQEDERKRIARELHDSLAQYLTAMRLTLRPRQSVDSGGESGLPVLELNALIDELDHAVNRMAWELRLVALDELGFEVAITHYLEEWAERARLPVETVVNLNGRVLPSVVETTLFRVVQEAATNVLRHACASRLSVILEVKGDTVRMIVEDDGDGFDQERVQSGTGASGQFGLVGMRERLALVHGTLDVESTPGHGTTLFIEVPIGQRWRSR
jgi:signal transduction histidine kinase